MRGFVELTNAKIKVLLPVGSFEVWEGTKTCIQPCGLLSEACWTCEESYDEVKELIQAAQEPESKHDPEPKRKFVILNQSNTGPLSICVDDFLTAITKNGKTFVLLKSGGGVYVSESVYDVIDLIEEAQEP